MRTTILLLFLCAVMCPATTLTDPFHQAQGCTYSYTSPYDGGCDVIGNEANYDIQKVSLTITGTTATVQLYFNSGAATAGSPLGSFTDAGDTLIVGDLFFYNPNTPYDPSTPALAGSTAADLTYAVPLDTVSRSGLSAGALYSVSTSEEADSAVGPGHPVTSGSYYRQDETVLMTGGTKVSNGTGVTVANFGNGTTSAAYVVTVSFQTTSAFLTSVENSGGQIGILFSSADCANDVIQGVVNTTVPEPQSMVLIAGGLGLLIGVGAWRRRTTRKSQAV
jgi:hypothetical protein